MTRGLRLVDKDSGTSPDLAQPPATPINLWRSLVEETDGDLALATLEAAVDVLEDADEDAYLPEVLQEKGVTALNGSFASVVAKAARDGGWERLSRLHQLLVDLPTDDPTGGLDDVRDGVLQLLDVADEEPERLPTISLGLPLEWWDLSAEQRRRWLAFAADVGAVIPLEIVVGPVDRHRLEADHADVLPTAAVNDRPNRPTTRARARASLAEGVRESPAWAVMRVLARTDADRLPLRRLYADTLLSDVSESAVRHRVGKLADLELVQRLDVDGERHVALTPAGSAALELAGGADRLLNPHQSDTEDDDEGDSVDSQNPGVNNPPNRSAGTVDAYAGTGEPPRPDAEAAVASDEAAAADATPAASTRWLPLHRHHAAAAAADSGQVALDDVRDGSMLDRDSPGDVAVSTDPDRKEVVVSIEFSSTIARTATRLAAALASDRVAGRVLTDERIGDRLEGLADGNLPVLRLARQLGWIPDDGADSVALRQRLGSARNQLLQDLTDVGSGEEFDAELASSVTRRAQGLAGTVTHILDLLGWDLTRVVDVPECSRNVVGDRAGYALGRWMAVQTAVSARYGHYNAYRVLFEQREDRRETMLGSPVIDDPRGDVIGSWVVRGTRAQDLESQIHPGQHLHPVDGDRRNAEAFLLDVEIVDADRRESTAAAVARLGSFKRLEPTRQAVSLLHATVSTWGAAEALSNLGVQDLGTERPVLLDELRFALGTLEQHQLLPTVDGHGAAAVLHQLLQGDRLSKGEVARNTGVSKPTVSSAVEVLQGLGLVETEDLGTGRADLLVLRLPDREDREADDQPRPVHLNDDTTGWERQTMTGAVLEAVHSVTDVWIPADHPDLYDALQEGRVRPIVERWPWLDSLRELLARMVGPDLRDQLAPPAPEPRTSTFGRRPTGRQTAIPGSGGASSPRYPRG